MEIRLLPEITQVQSDDWLIIQRGNLTAKIKKSNLFAGVSSGGNDGNNGNNDGGEEEVKRIISSNEPSQKEEGLEWCEIDGNKSIINKWFWMPHPVTSELCWRTANKSLITSQQGTSENITPLPLDGSNNMYFTDVTFASVSNNSQLQINLERESNFSVNSFKEIFMSSNRLSSSLYSLQNGNSSGTATTRIRVTPSDNLPYMLVTSLRYSLIRVVYSFEGGF
jgi:hypothetical protein